MKVSKILTTETMVINRKQLISNGKKFRAACAKIIKNETMIDHQRNVTIRNCHVENSHIFNLINLRKGIKGNPRSCP
jgi:hypothetical protein